MNVDIIIAPGMNEALAAKDATTTIPIVTVVASDPVGSRLVDSLARPGRNITGLTAISAELSGEAVGNPERKLFPESLILLSSRILRSQVPHLRSKNWKPRPKRWGFDFKCSL